MPPEENKLAQAVTTAVETTPKGEEVKPAAAVSEPEEEQEQPETYGLSPEEEVNSRQLFAALKDPSKAPIVIKFLAEQAGIITTKEQAKEAKDDVETVLKDALGPEFEIISKRLAPAIDKIINKRLEEGLADTRAKMSATQEARLTDEAEIAQKEIARTYFDADTIPDDILNAMSKQMDRQPPSSTVSVGDYINDIFAGVAFRKGITVKRADTRAARVNNNRTDVASRLASERRGSPSAGDKLPSKMSLNDAVTAAVEQVSRESS